MELVSPVMTLLRLALAARFAGLLVAPAWAEDAPIHHHALSLIGEPKYPADFNHFDFVNPDAPKGGLVRMADIGSFDSLNPVLYKGEAAAGLGLVYENLMADSLDEPSTSYGLIAEWASYPPDYSSVTFKLRDEARWQDGTPITPEDVIYSLGVNKDANPRMGLYYKNVSRAEATGPNEVTFYFDVKNNRELPMIMGQLTILPKHYWTGKDASGNQRDPMKTTLEPPLGSGPYRIKEVKPGRSISYERVEDYWGKDLAVNSGQWNYDEIRFDYYRDETVAFESFKAGNLDYWQETSAKNWATAYDFPAAAQRLRQAPGSARSSGRSRCNASCSICGARNSRTAACGKPSISPSISSGPTRTCSMANMRGSAATSRAASSPRRRRRPRGASSKS